MEDVEQRMIDAARRGRAEGYKYLMTRYGRRVHLLVSAVMSDARDAEEVAQDAFVRAFERLDMFDGRRASFGTWIGRIAYNLALNAVRGQGSEGVDFLESLDSLEALDYLDNLERLDNLDNIESIAPEARRLMRLDAAIERLRPEERTLLHLRYYDGLSLGEIAEVMDVEPGPLANRLHRIRQKIGKLMEQ